ncbi:MAG: 2-hydroxychromene-2-carboxylate isomerase [Burkholderiales bacterium]|nr:2-hydroxychromene-2-carboxylate isomerase [Burkholderiales bacterium]
MGRTVEFFFDFGSPASYLAHTQLPGIAARAGATLVCRPMLLGGVFKATGNASPVTIAAKGRWMAADLARFAARYGVPLRMPPNFPVNTLAMMRGAVGMQMRRPADFARYATAMFDAMFARGLDMADPAVFAGALAGAGFDVAAFQALVADPEVKQGLVAATEEAVARGVFGAPTMFVGDEMHFGQDRLDFVAAALAR